MLLEHDAKATHPPAIDPNRWRAAAHLFEWRQVAGNKKPHRVATMGFFDFRFNR
jgi:hypothetical protein